MLTHENATDFARVGGAEFSKNDDVSMRIESPEVNKRVAIADLVGALRFIVDNLNRAAFEATTAADAISGKNIVAGHYHTARFAAHARAAVGAFRDVLDVGANG